jgi:hypothetical protein
VNHLKHWSQALAFAVLMCVALVVFGVKEIWMRVKK